LFAIKIGEKLFHVIKLNGLPHVTSLHWLFFLREEYEKVNSGFVLSQRETKRS